MSPVITATHLSRSFPVALKKPGIRGALKGLFWREYKQVSAVNDISLEINEGELVGFIGPNGAGKTTTLKMFSGLLCPTSGRVRVLGVDPFDRSHPFLRQISLVMGQKNQLWWDLPAADTFLLQKEIYSIAEDDFTKRLGELVEMLGVGDVLDTPVRKLSLGQRMKMELIASLLHRPKVLFLDEPTIGLDVVAQEQMRVFLKDYNERYNATILLTSHYMEDVKALCPRVVVIDHGKLLFDGLLADLIAKYTKHKLVTLRLEKRIPLKTLQNFGTVTAYDYPSVTFSAVRSQTKQLALRLLKELPVEDIDVAEAKIEDVIKEVFGGK